MPHYMIDAVLYFSEIKNLSRKLTFNHHHIYEILEDMDVQYRLLYHTRISMDVLYNNIVCKVFLLRYRTRNARLLR